MSTKEPITEEHKSAAQTPEIKKAYSMPLETMDAKIKTPKDVQPVGSWQEWWKKKDEMNQALIKAVKIKDFNKVKGCLDAAKHKDLVADINALGHLDYTPLHTAVQLMQKDIVKFLLMKGAEVNARSKSMRTPLHIACMQNNVEILEMLCQNDHVDMIAEDQDRNTPLHLACQAGLK